MHEALQSAEHLESDYADPAERVAITMVTKDGRVARHWADLSYHLGAAEVMLESLVATLNTTSRRSAS